MQRFEACIVLSAVGDVIGFKNGRWEFMRDGSKILLQFHELTQNKGLRNLHIDKNWLVSDDTVMHLATIDALLSHFSSQPLLFCSIKLHFIPPWQNTTSHR